MEYPLTFVMKKGFPLISFFSLCASPHHHCVPEASLLGAGLSQVHTCVPLRTVAAFQTVRECDQGRGEDSMASTALRHPWSFLFTAQRGPCWPIITKKQNNTPGVDNLSGRGTTLLVTQETRKNTSGNSPFSYC